MKSATVTISKTENNKYQYRIASDNVGYNVVGYADTPTGAVYEFKTEIEELYHLLEKEGVNHERFTWIFKLV